VTIGAAGYRANESMEQLIKRADIALYRGKEGGRDRVVLEERPFAINLIGIGGQLSA
jgi:PleD family two-component response regulator